jgi:hypothetical protein
MMKAILLAAMLLLTGDAKCPFHPYASCYDTGQIVTASGAHIWKCSCGDKVYVAN